MASERQKTEASWRSQCASEDHLRSSNSRQQNKSQSSLRSAFGTSLRNSEAAN